MIKIIIHFIIKSKEKYYIFKKSEDGRIEPLKVNKIKVNFDIFEWKLPLSDRLMIIRKFKEEYKEFENSTISSVKVEPPINGVDGIDGDESILIVSFVTDKKIQEGEMVKEGTLTKFDKNHIPDNIKKVYFRQYSSPSSHEQVYINTLIVTSDGRLVFPYYNTPNTQLKKIDATHVVYADDKTGLIQTEPLQQQWKMRIMLFLNSISNKKYDITAIHKVEKNLFQETIKNYIKRRFFIKDGVCWKDLIYNEENDKRAKNTKKKYTYRVVLLPDKADELDTENICIFTFPEFCDYAIRYVKKNTSDEKEPLSDSENIGYTKEFKELISNVFFCNIQVFIDAICELCKEKSIEK